MKKNRELVVLLISLIALFSRTVFADLADSYEESSKANEIKKEKETFNQKKQETQDLEDKTVKAPTAKSAYPEQAQPKKIEKKGHTEKKKKNEKKDEAKHEPINFQSDNLTGVRHDGVVELIENVVVTQADLRLEANKAKIFFEEKSKEVKNLFAFGNVKITKKDEVSGKPIKAFGDTAEFDNEKQIMTLRGDAKLYKGDDVINGNVIFYNLKTGWIKAEQVKGVVNPSSNKPEGR